MIDGRYIHGGLSDRIRGMASIYGYCKRHHIPLSIYHTVPFDLSIFLEPNIYDWRISSTDISYGKQDRPMLLFGNLIPSKFHKFYLAWTIKKARRTNSQVHIYTHALFYDKEFSINFQHLFKPSKNVLSAVENSIKGLGDEYIACVFRFQNLLNDFKEGACQPLPPEERSALIEDCIQHLEELHRQHHPQSYVLVTSDSTTFTHAIRSRLSYVRIIEGEVAHMDYTTDASTAVYQKSFVDLLSVAKAKRIYLFRTGAMYASGFALRAAKIYNTPYGQIEW